MERSMLKSQLMNKSYQLISVALQKGVEANFRIAAKRATMAHSRRACPEPPGLSACQMQNMIGAHERALAFGSQEVA